MTVLLQAMPSPSASASPTAGPTTFGAGVITFAFLISFLTWAPLLMAVVVAVLPEQRRRGARSRRLWLTAFWTNLLLLAVTIIVYSSQFSVFGSGIQFEEKMPWLPGLGVNYHMGVTGIGMVMLVLSGLVGVVATLAAFDLRDRAREFLVLLLLVQGAVNGTIGAQNLLLLVLFWAGSTVPLALLVAGWGGPRRWQAAGRLAGYWSLGTAALLVGGLLLATSYGNPSLELSDLAQARPGWQVQAAAALLITVAAASRLPLVPLHGWAREVLAEAHPAVAVLVAGAVTRLGGDLLLKLYVGANQDGARMIARVLVCLAALTVVYAAIAAFRTRDIRRLAAYLALIPGGITALGVAGLSPLSLDGAGFSLLAGGLAAALMVGVAATFAERAASRSLAVAAGLAGRVPKLAWLLVAGTLAVLSVPFLATFPALLMILAGSFRTQAVGAFVVVGGLAVAAAAVAWLLHRALFGPASPDSPTPSDASLSESWYLGILAGALLWVGLVPSGPKLAGIPLLDPGVVNVITQATSDLSSPYAPSPPPTPGISSSPPPSQGANPAASPSPSPSP